MKETLRVSTSLTEKSVPLEVNKNNNIEDNKIDIEKEKQKISNKFKTLNDTFIIGVGTSASALLSSSKAIPTKTKALIVGAATTAVYTGSSALDRMKETIFDNIEDLANNRE